MFTCVATREFVALLSRQEALENGASPPLKMKPATQAEWRTLRVRS